MSERTNFDRGFGEARPHDLMHPLVWAELLRFYSAVPLQRLSPEDRADWERRQRVIAQCKEGMFPREAIDWSGDRGVDDSEIDRIVPEVRDALARAEGHQMEVLFDHPFGFNCKALNRQVWVKFRSHFVAELQRWAMDRVLKYSTAKSASTEPTPTFSDDQLRKMIANTGFATLPFAEAKLILSAAGFDNMSPTEIALWSELSANHRKFEDAFLRAASQRGLTFDRAMHVWKHFLASQGAMFLSTERKHGIGEGELPRPPD